MNSEKKVRKKRKTTATRSFGASLRMCHDATSFYSSRLYEGIAAGGSANESLTDGVGLIEREEPVTEARRSSHQDATSFINRLHCKSSEKMDEIPDGSIHLVVTSPPYNVTKDYDENLSLIDHLEFLERVFTEVFRKLADGGRVCVNIANLGRKPYIPMHSHIINIMDRIGFLMRGEIIWEKGVTSGVSCAWGSWKSASNPVLRDSHEYILVYSKGNFSRKKENGENTITREEFLEYTKSIWSFPTVSAKKACHPAPFPEELPYRLIQLYTYSGDNVLDPFCGSGTTCLTALKTGRNYIGYDIKQEYIDLAAGKIEETKSMFSGSLPAKK